MFCGLWVWKDLNKGKMRKTFCQNIAKIRDVETIPLPLEAMQ